MDTNSNSTHTNPSLLRHHFLSLHYLQRSKRSLFALLSLLLLLLLAYNGATIFCIHVPFPAKTPPEPTSFVPESAAGESRRWTSSSAKFSSSVMHAVKEENPPSIPKIHLPLLQKSQNLVLSTNDSSIYIPKPRRKHKPMFRILRSESRPKRFSTRVKEFLGANSSCKVRFFMTWISSLDSFGDRELFTVQSLFKSHPNACLIIVSNSMDSRRGMQVLRPFLDKGYRVTSISPDFDYLFKNTIAEAWFDGLRKGNVDPGEVSLGQNLSNLLRLALLYKFGGVYIDTDVLVLKRFVKLRNVIGAQTMDVETGNWSRLNNAVMIFDKGHPLLYKFIEEFAHTFNGNKWGHNGPYLVSRVVSRVNGRPGFDFKVLPPVAFYPVDWSRIRGLFRGPRNETHLKWLRGKLRHIRSQSLAVHLWNRQSRKLKVEKGSIISHIMSDCCVFCNSSVSTL
uniref:Putative lactosylceramide 4-alpha-galactosyltransferase n=1 Tax=Davidia involucrata TaxID=16924 RepID=A0A5B6YVK3_DAVIN